MEVLTPSELNTTDSIPYNSTINLVVTSGNVDIAAFVCFTSEIDYIEKENITFKGSWLEDVEGGGTTSANGNATDIAGDYAKLKCPEDGEEVSWVVSSRPDSQPVNVWTSANIQNNVSTSGGSHFKVIGNLKGRNETHYIECANTLTPAGSATSGYGLHIVGALIVKDR